VIHSTHHLARVAVALATVYRADVANVGALVVLAVALTIVIVVAALACTVIVLEMLVVAVLARLVSLIPSRARHL
jgi:hypothetical protein